MKKKKSVDLTVTTTIEDSSSVPNYITLFKVPKGFVLREVKINIIINTGAINPFNYKDVKFHPSTIGIDSTPQTGLYKELSPLHGDKNRPPVELDEEFEENTTLVLVPENLDNLDDSLYPVDFAFRLRGVLYPK